MSLLENMILTFLKCRFHDSCVSVTSSLLCFFMYVHLVLEQSLHIHVLDMFEKHRQILENSVGFVYISSWWLRLFILDRNSTEILFLSQPLLSRRYMMISCLVYSGVDYECFSGVWSPCSDCVHILFCNKASAYFKINRDGFYLTLSAVKSDTF